jgi:hypothetical protein
LLSQLRPGARIVSHAFDMGEWRPDETERVGGAWIHLWTVPARVDGAWRFTDEAGRAGELRISQRFQTFTGALRTDGENLPIARGRVTGDRVDFAVAAGGRSRAYAGRMSDNRIVPVDPAQSWHAERGGETADE